MDKNLEAHFQAIYTDIDLNRPAGYDVRRDNEYEWLANESEKLNSLYGSKSVDFSMVYELSYKLLTKKTKDLKVLGWWLISSLKLEPYENISVITEIIIEFLDKYGICGYPERAKAKQLCVEWIIELWQKFLDKDKNVQYSQMILEKIRVLDIKLQNYFLGSSVTLYNIKQHIENKTETIRISKDESLSEKTEKQTPSKADDIDKNEKCEEADNKITINSEKEEQKAIRIMLDSTSHLMSYWSKDPGLIMNTLLMNRANSWSQIKRIPSHTDFKTILKPLPIEKQQYYSNIIKDDPCIASLIEIEQSLLKTPFWLSGHLYAMQILQKIEKIQENNMVARLLISLLDRLPELKNMMFDNGEKFINEDELDNLYKLREAEVKTNGKKTQKEESNIKTLLAKALNLYRAGKRSEAYAIFQDKIKKENSKRLKLLYNMALIELSIVVGKTDIANYKFEEIKNEYTLINRSEYEPLLELELLKLKRRYNALIGSKLKVEDKTDLESKICKLNVCELL